MATSYFPFDSGAGANVSESQWTKMARHWLGTGVIKDILNELQVYADSTGRQVKVKSGAAWINGHYFESDSITTLAIGTASSSNPRIDRVVIRLDWTANTITLAVVQGTAAASPSAPSLTQSASKWEISLAQVRVNASVSTIEADKVTDERTIVKNANTEQESIFKIPLLNGALEDTGRGIQVFKDELGLVHIWVNVSFSQDTTVSMKIGVLPEGYRPSFSVTDHLSGFAADLSTVRHGNITIPDNGEIILGAPAGGGWRYIHKALAPFKGV